MTGEWWRLEGGVAFGEGEECKLGGGGKVVGSGVGRGKGGVGRGKG